MIGGRALTISIFGAFTLFFVAAWLVPTKLFIELARAIHISVVTAVLISYGRYGLRALFMKHPNGSDILVLGITLSFLSHVLYASLVLVWRLSGQPAWLINSDMTAFTVALSSVAGLCYLAAPNAIEGHVPPRNRVVMGVSIGAGVMMMLVVLVFHFDLTWIADIVRPYLAEPGSEYGRSVFQKINDWLG